MNRRTFLQTSLAAAAASALPAAALAQRKLGAIGVQFYSVRDLMKADVAGTLAEGRGDRVQGGRVRGALRPGHRKPCGRMLDKNGLTAPASHVDWATVETKLPETLATARILGHRFLIVPWVGEEERKQPDIWKKAAALFNKAGKECQAARHPVRLPPAWLRVRPVRGARRQAAVRLPPREHRSGAREDGARYLLDRRGRAGSRSPTSISTRDGFRSCT